MFGHSPATRHHAIRTGSWLALEALTNARCWRRVFAAVCVIALACSLIPLAAKAARKLAASYGAHSHPSIARTIPYPRLEWPLEISGGQYVPVAWGDIAGWSADDHLQAYKAFRTSCKSIPSNKSLRPTPRRSALRCVS